MTKKNKPQVDLAFKKLLGKNPTQTQIVAHPDTIEKLVKEGIVKIRHITYKEYSDKLYEDRKKDSVLLLSKLPQINDSIADSIVTNIYEEIRSSYAFGVFTATIFNSILLLEYSMRNKLYRKRLKSDPNTEWSIYEKLNMKSLIPKLKKAKLITKSEATILDDFSNNLRNPYLHFNIHRLIAGVGISKLPRLNIETGEITELVSGDANKYRSLWFSAKQFFDKERVQDIINFCVHWTNKLLSRTD